jgi:uncharacterized membrane protein
MMDFFLRLFGLKTSGAGKITDTSIGFHGVNPVYVFIAAVLLGVLVFWMYRRSAEHLTTPRKVILAALRGMFLLLILGLLLRPVLTIAFEQSVRRTLLVLVDTSQSMGELKDKRSDSPDDLKRVAIAKNVLDPTEGLKQSLPENTTALAEVARLEVAKSALRNSRLELLQRLSADYDIGVFTFDKSLNELPAAGYQRKIDENNPAGTDAGDGKVDTAWVDKLEGKGQLSALGDAVREVISRKRGQPLAGILLVSDGASNSGVQPVDAAILAGKDRVPIYAYGVGITSPRDVIISNIFAQEVAFAKDEVPVSVRVQSTGMAGQTATVMLELGEERAEKQISFSGDGEQVVTLGITPKKPGDFQLKVTVPPREDEVSKKNNEDAQKIRVIDGKIKVLFVEQYPRWEFQYAQAVLMRDRRIDPKFVLLEGDPNIARGTTTPYLREFPTKKEDLFKYDLIIIGDVDPKTFNQAQMEMISEFVSKFGGAVVMVAGKRHAPNSYRRTPLEKMLPVELETVDLTANTPANRPVKLELTPAGRANAMLRLAEDQVASANRWASLPPIYWMAKVARAKPAAEVLVVDPDPAKSSRYGKMPVIAMQQYGLGQVMFVGTDNLWRWRRNAGDKYHSMLWGQMTQRMALPHLLGASKRTQLMADQKKYTTGQRVTIFARLYSESFEPMQETSTKGHFAEKGGAMAPREVMLRPIPGQPGMYRGELIAPAPGAYEFAMDHDKNTLLEFEVEDPKQELTETAMNKQLLEQMASVSGGAFVREEDLHQLPEKMKGKMERMRSKLEVEIWSSPIYFLAMLGLVTTEWILRKVSQLK